jgi:serine/threonine-protein kinase HipA
MTSELVAPLDGREVGRVRNDARGRLTLVYDNDWRQAEGAYPLSLSMPLAAEEHGPSAVQAFLWGLLPDNERVLERWARKFQVSARNVFALISHVGEDCAGAVQFVTSDRLEVLRSGAGDKVEWLDETAIAKHLLKPPTGHFDGHAENEHICLMLARNLGLPVADTKVMRFGKEIAIVIERYDRQFSGNEIVRVHQEDICQALGIPPTRKYQSEGGPTPADVIELLRTYSTDRVADVDTFIDALGFNWLIAGTDAHAKNYSLLLAGGPLVRLAPLYDIASILPYDDVDMQKIKLAMKIGGEYKLSLISLRDWQKLARETRLDPDKVIAGLNSMAEQLPDIVTAVRAQAQKDGLDNAIIGRLAEYLIARAMQCRRLLGGA